MSIRSPLIRIRVSLATSLCLLTIPLTTLRAADSDTAAQLIEQSRVQGGLVIHLGCGSGELTRELRVNSRYQVHGLDRDATAIDVSRRMLLEAGV